MVATVPAATGAVELTEEEDTELYSSTNAAELTDEEELEELTVRMGA